jgi:exodeoxyribonuclease V beta subunit
MVQKRYTLASNFRSTPELIEAVNTLFSCNTNPFLFQEIGFAPVSSGKPDQRDYILQVRGKSCGNANRPC